MFETQGLSSCELLCPYLILLPATDTSCRAVLDSRNNLANQEVFKIAKGADPDGTRTIGVMTKLDALQEGDEQAVIIMSFTRPACS